jgi:hypothetical protein
MLALRKLGRSILESICTGRHMASWTSSFAACELLFGEAAAGNDVLERLGPMGRLRLAVAWGILIILVCAMLLIVAYLGRVWRRALRQPLPPMPLEEDAWARKPLAADPLEEDDDDDSRSEPEGGHSAS